MNQCIYISAEWGGSKGKKDREGHGEETHGHDHATQTHVRTQPLADACAFPEYAEEAGWLVVY